MCVIIYKPAGVEMPSKEILTACYKANKDGIGFATPTAMFKSVNVNKVLQELKKVSTFEPCIIHFRYATHGSVKDANCHPFANKDLFFAHNGVLNIKSENDMTDSEICFRKTLIPAFEKFGFGKGFENVVNKVIGSSRFIFLQGEKVAKFGNWYAENGVFYSNLNWRYYLKSERSYYIEYTPKNFVYF